MELPSGKYSIILTDPPWQYTVWKGKPSRTSDAHYNTMPIKEIAALPMLDLLEGDAAVFLWSTPPMMDAQIEVLKGWGLRYVTVAFTWVKLGKKKLKWADALVLRQNGAPIAYYRNDPYQLHFGMGHYSRANTELCLLGMRGKMSVSDKSIRQAIVAPIREHSTKPDEVYERIDAMYPTGWRLEMFARPNANRPAYWKAWGEAMEGTPHEEENEEVVGSVVGN